MLRYMSVRCPSVRFSSILRAVSLAVLLVATAPTTSGCHASTPYDYGKEPDPRKTEYEIGPLDQLSVVVWKNRELSADVAVRPDGIVTLPLIGDVRAAGQTPTQLQREIAKRYADYIRSEESVISVGVTAVNSYSFTVSGNVEHAGLYNTKSYVTAVEALTMAGGPNKYAGDSFYILRGTPVRRIPVDLRRVTSGEHPEENLVILRGDLIVVP